MHDVTQHECRLPLKLRCGDTVRHRPSGETWEVAYADYVGTYMAWSGWPEGEAKIADCEIVARCSDEEHDAAVSRWLDVPHRSENGRQDRRIGMVRRLYRPEEERRMQRHAVGRACGELADRIASLAGSGPCGCSAMAMLLRDFAKKELDVEPSEAAR